MITIRGPPINSYITYSYVIVLCRASIGRTCTSASLTYTSFSTHNHWPTLAQGWYTVPVVDFTGVSNEPIPPGDYSVVLTKSTFKPKSGQSKGDNLNWELTVEDEEYAGRKLFMNLSLLPQSLWSTKESLLAFGTDPETFDTPFDIEQEATSLLGSKAVAVVDIAPDFRDNSKLRNVVKKVAMEGFGG